jgi:hypothetical protein
MSDNKTNLTLHVAKILLGHLVEPINGELRDLLDRAESGIPVTRDINRLLYGYDNVRLWMDEQISRIQSETKGLESRGFGSIPGNPNTVSASQKWICPKKKCDHWFLVIQEGQDPPICEEHKIEMVRGTNEKG